MRKNRAISEQIIRVAVVENDPLRSVGFQTLLGSVDDLDLAHASPSDFACLKNCDVLILGRHDEISLLSTIKSLKESIPLARIIVVGKALTDQVVLDALASGAKGYLTDTSSLEDLVRAIRVVNQGLVWASRRVVGLFVERCSKPAKHMKANLCFTDREKDVLRLLIGGRSNREIAVPLGIEIRTVKAHIAALMRKVGVRNRIALCSYALNHSLLVN